MNILIDFADIRMCFLLDQNREQACKYAKQEFPNVSQDESVCLISRSHIIPGKGWARV